MAEKTKLRQYQTANRAHYATELRKFELSKISQHDEEIQQLKRIKDEFKQSEREDAHAAGESYTVRQKIEESRRSWIAYHAQGPAVRRQTSVQQSALLVEHRRKVPVDAKVIRHGLGPRDRSIVLNDAVAEEVVVQERTWDKVMRELLSNNKVLRRGRTAQVKVMRANSVQFLDDELRLLEAADRTGVRMQRVRNGSRIANPDTENSRLRDGFEEVFMSRHIDTRYAAPMEAVDRSESDWSSREHDQDWSVRGILSKSGGSNDNNRSKVGGASFISSAPVQWTPAIHVDVKPWHIQAPAPLSQSTQLSSSSRSRKSAAPRDESMDVMFPPTVEDYFDDSSSNGNNSSGSLSAAQPIPPRDAMSINLDEVLVSPPRVAQLPSIRVDFTPPERDRHETEHGSGVPDASWTMSSEDAPPSHRQHHSRREIRSGGGDGIQFTESPLGVSLTSTTTTDGSASTHKARHDTMGSPVASRSVSSSSASLSSLDSLDVPGVRVTQSVAEREIQQDLRSTPQSLVVGSNGSPSGSVSPRSLTSEGALRLDASRSSADSSSSSQSSRSSDQASLYVEYQHLMGAALSPAASVRSSISSREEHQRLQPPQLQQQQLQQQWSVSLNSSWSSDATPVLSSIRVVAKHELSSSGSGSSTSSRSDLFIGRKSPLSPSRPTSLAHSTMAVADSVRSSVDGGEGSNLSVASGDTDTLFRQWDELYRSSQAAIAQSRTSSASKSTPTSSAFTRDSSSSSSSNSNNQRRPAHDSFSSVDDQEQSYVSRHMTVNTSHRSFASDASPVQNTRRAPSVSMPAAESYEEGRAEAILKELDALSAQWNSRQFGLHSTPMVDSTRTFTPLSSTNRLDLSASVSSSSVSLDASNNRQTDSPLLYSVTEMRRQQTDSSMQYAARTTSVNQRDGVIEGDYLSFLSRSAMSAHNPHSSELRRSGDSMSTLSSPATSVVLTAIVALPPGVEPPTVAVPRSQSVTQSAVSPPRSPWSRASNSGSGDVRLSSSSSGSRAAESQDSVLFSEREAAPRHEEESIELSMQHTPTGMSGYTQPSFSRLSDEDHAEDEEGDALHALRRTTFTSTPLTAYSLRSGHNRYLTASGGHYVDSTPSQSSLLYQRSPHSLTEEGISMVSVQSLRSDSTPKWGSVSRSYNSSRQQQENYEEIESSGSEEEEDSQLSEQSLDSLLEYRRANSSFV